MYNFNVIQILRFKYLKINTQINDINNNNKIFLTHHETTPSVPWTDRFTCILSTNPEVITGQADCQLWSMQLIANYSPLG